MLHLASRRFILSCARPLFRRNFSNTQPHKESLILPLLKNVKDRQNLGIYDTKETPRYYPSGGSENAGQAHIRLHKSTKKEGIKLRQNSNNDMSDEELIDAYRRAYGDTELDGILGDLRTPNCATIICTDASPGEAFENLLRWGERNRSE